MWTINEPMTARRITRLKFLEQESEQLRSYKSDLEFCLISTKRLLSEILSAKVIISHRRIDSSGDTEVSSHVPLKTLESSLEKNCDLMVQFKQLKKDRDLVLGKLLICEQMAEETIRKETEIIQESEDQTNDIKYVLYKKEARITNLKSKIEVIEDQISKLKNESVVMLTLTEENLNLFKQTEKIKTSLSKISKKLQITENQTEELVQHFNNLAEHLEQYKILVKNPTIRNKKPVNLNTTQALDLKLGYSLEDSDSSSSEVCFPDKLQIETKFKPKLPKLDFTKMLKQVKSEKIEKNPYLQLKSKNQFLEKKCKEKTELLNQLRMQIQMQIAKNAKIVKQLNGKKKTEPSPVKNNEKQRRKRALSNTLEYLAHPTNEIDKVIVTEEKVNSSSQESFGNISSFNGSEVAKLDYLEPDSILAEYIHEIVNE